MPSSLNNDESLKPDKSLKSDNGRWELRFQDDGNLVLYLDAKTVWWSSKTNGKGGKECVLQGDGNLVIYCQSGRQDAIWSSGTGGHQGQGISLWMRDNGEIQIIANNIRLWQSNTGIKLFRKVRFTTDAQTNFVPIAGYMKGDKAVWHGTSMSTSAGRDGHDFGAYEGGSAMVASQVVNLGFFRYVGGVHPIGPPQDESHHWGKLSGGGPGDIWFVYDERADPIEVYINL